MIVQEINPRRDDRGHTERVIWDYRLSISVHESLILPQSQLELVKAALIEAFEQNTGVVPKLNIRYPS